VQNGAQANSVPPSAMIQVTLTGLAMRKGEKPGVIRLNDSAVQEHGVFPQADRGDRDSQANRSPHRA